MNNADYPQLSHGRIAYIFVLNNRIVLIKGGCTRRVPPPHMYFIMYFILYSYYKITGHVLRGINTFPTPQEFYHVLPPPPSFEIL